MRHPLKTTAPRGQATRPSATAARPGEGWFRLAWTIPTLLGVMLVAAANDASRGQTPAADQTRDQQVADLKKQIEALARKVDELSKPADAKAEPAKPAGIVLGPEWLKSLAWRPIGPANMGGRITALSVYEADPSTFWVATAGGGLLKTVNNGVSFEHQFDKEATVAVGDVAVAQSDKNIVWVGTGESNPRNSVSYGDGVYKSTDGGKTWKNMGLKDTFQIGRVLVHPKDPNTVYVGALGRLYGPSESRGLFKTTDGGATWNKVLYVDDKTGVIDAKMSPADPDTLLVATYERLRGLYDEGDPVTKWAPGSAIHKTTDGGKTFKKITAGLPSAKLGRIGLDFYRKDPKTVFAIVDSEKVGTGPRPKGASAANQAYLGVVGEGPEAAGAVIGQVTPEGPAAKAGLRPGDRIKKVDDKEIKTYDEFATLLREKKVGDKVKVTLERDAKPVEAEVALEARPGTAAAPAAASGATGVGGGGEGVAGLGLDPNRPFGSQLGGQIENAQDRQGPDGPQTGGVYKSTDGGDTWTRVNSLNPRPFYFSQIRVDPSDEKYVYVLGLAVHRSENGGKTFTADGGRSVHADHHALWVDPKDGRHLILAGDGGFYVSYDRAAAWDHLNTQAIGQFYHVAIDPRRPMRAYGGLQDNGSWGGPTQTRSADGPVNEDWVNVGGGDGFHCLVDPSEPDVVYSTSQYGVLSRRSLKTGGFASIRPVVEKGERHRFNWNTPMVLSSHNPKIFYTAGEKVFRSLNQGEGLRAISPEIARTKQGTATALAESPKNAEVLYVGTDDGLLWVTRDGGKNWTDVTKNVGLDRHCHVATIETSRAEEGRAYVVFDGHRSDTDDPLVYVTEDFGTTWKSLKANLPRGSTRCLREDLFNPNLLYLGTEFAVWASHDRGVYWNRINANLPTVAVHELAQHPTSGEIVAATHGRSLWVADVAGLRQITPEVLKANATLLKPTTAVRWQGEPERGGTNRRFVGKNPPRGAQIDVAVAGKVEKASLKIYDYDGTAVYTGTVSTDPGLHRLSWSMTRPATPQAANRPGTPGGGGGRGGFFGRRALPAAPGMYKVVLTVDGKESVQPLKVEADPGYPNAPEITLETLEALDEARRADPDADMEGDEDDGKIDD